MQEIPGVLHTPLCIGVEYVGQRDVSMMSEVVGQCDLARVMCGCDGECGLVSVLFSVSDMSALLSYCLIMRVQLAG